MSESKVQWVRDRDGLESVIRRIGEGPLALDSEADSLHHYPEKVCLVQLSFDGEDLLVDPLADADLSALGPVLEAPSTIKVLHGADYDLRVLHRDFGLEIRGLFDTMIAARLIGERAFGLARLLEKYFDVRLDKKHQRADWSRRPLTPEMERYAAMDTRYLLRLREILASRLEELGRGDWAAEEFTRLERVRWNDKPDPERFRRVRGSAKLSERELAVLRELHALRERAAREKDRPPFRVFHDDTMLRLAASSPRSPGELRGIRGLSAYWSSGAGARRLVEAVGRAMDLPGAELPEVRRGRRPRRDAELEDRLRRVSRERDRLAEELDLEPAVLGSKADIELALTSGPRQESDAGTGLRRWQLELLGPILERQAS